MQRVSSGIHDLDKIIEGGFPKGYVILYSGPPGTGKTTAAIQFIADGLRNSENCIFVSSEETRGKIIEHAHGIGIDLQKAIRENKLEIFQVEDIAYQDPLGRRVTLPTEPEKRADRLISSIKEWATKYEGKRLVIDSLTVYTITGKILHNADLFRRVNDLDMTTILVSELVGSESYSQDKVSEIMADGIILFDHKLRGDAGIKTIEVIKMADTNAVDKESGFTIGKEGIRFSD